MKIEYPRIVEIAAAQFEANGYGIPKDELYKQMVESKLITENGEATQFAIDNGYVSEDTSDEAKIYQFKHECPEFLNVADEHFKVVKGNVYIDMPSLRYVNQQVLNDHNATEEQKNDARTILELIQKKEK